MDIISAYAEEQGVAHTGSLTCANDKATKDINVAAIHDRMHGTAPCFSSMEGFTLGVKIGVLAFSRDSLWGWRCFHDESRSALGYIERQSQNSLGKLVAQPSRYASSWACSYRFLRERWCNCIPSCLPSGRRDRRTWQIFRKAFDGLLLLRCSVLLVLKKIGNKRFLSMQDLQDVEISSRFLGSRYLLTKAPRGVKFMMRRAQKFVGSSLALHTKFEHCKLLQSLSQGLRFAGFAADVVLDRCTARDENGYGAVYAPWFIDNPVSTSLKDKYVILLLRIHRWCNRRNRQQAWWRCTQSSSERACSRDFWTRYFHFRSWASCSQRKDQHCSSVLVPVSVYGVPVPSQPSLELCKRSSLFLFIERSVRDCKLGGFQQTLQTVTTSSYCCIPVPLLQQVCDGDSWSDSFTVQCDKQNNPKPISVLVSWQ